MTDKLIFVDKKILQKACNDYSRICITSKGEFSNSIPEKEAVTMDILPYLELTRFQCQIIADNLVSIVRFADSGKT